jgi:hypothetical protein
MSRKDKTERFSVPEDREEQFLLQVLLSAQMTGVAEDPEISHYIQLLREQVERKIFERTHKVSPMKKLNMEAKKYVAIFKQRYLQLTDLEYSRQVSPVDAKLMRQVTKALMEVGFEADEYLKWMFEEFLVENPKFCPPNIKWSGSGFVLDKFLYEHRAKMKEKKQAETRKREMLDLIERARTLMRCFVELGEKEKKEKVKALLKKHSDEGIMVTELRSQIQAFEGQLRQLGQSGQSGNKG